MAGEPCDGCGVPTSLVWSRRLGIVWGLFGSFDVPSILRCARSDILQNPASCNAGAQKEAPTRVMRAQTCTTNSVELMTERFRGKYLINFSGHLIGPFLCRNWRRHFFSSPNIISLSPTLATTRHTEFPETTFPVPTRALDVAPDESATGPR